MNKEDIQASFLKLKEGWELIGEKKIRKEFGFKDFIKALSFVNKVGEIAEKEGHHPDIGLSYGNVVVELSTHDAGELSEKDFVVAKKIDLIIK